MPTRLLLDSNIYDAITKDNDLGELFISAQQLGLITHLSTHIEHDQLSRMPDGHNKDLNICVYNSSTTTTTSGFVVGYSKLNWADINDTDLNTIIGSQRPNPRNISDALLCTTAIEKADIFVTNDRRLYKKCKTQQKVLNAGELKIYLQTLIKKTP